MAVDSDDRIVYEDFLNYAHEQNKKVCGFYVGGPWHRKQFDKKPLGTSSKLEMHEYNIKSSKSKEVRRALRKGASNGYKIVESENIDFDQLKKLIKIWKTRKLPLKIKFLLSEPKVDNQVSSFDEWYAIEKNGRYFAFCSTLPYKVKERQGIYIDHLIYNPIEEKFALSFLISSLLQKFKAENIDEINFGLNPFAKIKGKGLIEKTFLLLYHMPLLYRPKGLHFFKNKFSNQEDPEFFFYEKGNSPLTSLAAMVKTTLKRE